jgi:hypothetical protein
MTITITQVVHLLTGSVLFKVLDDIHDNDLKVAPSVVNLLGVILYVVSALYLVEDSLFLVGALISTVAARYMGQVDNAYWEGWSVIPFVVLLWKWPSWDELIDNWPEKTLALSAFVVFILFEGLYFTYETGRPKIIFRLVVTAVCIALVVYLFDSPRWACAVHVLLVMGGYCTTSLIYLLIFHEAKDRQQAPPVDTMNP